jgi:hypothetical protein
VRLRLFGILFVAIAGILPISDKILTHLLPSKLLLFGYLTPKDFRPDAAWSTILIALAGLFFFLDRFLGYSSRWIRYTLTWVEMQKALHTFEMDWHIARSAQEENISTLLQRAKTFMETVDTLFQNETNEWAAEFRDTLRQVDSMAQNQIRLQAQNTQKATPNTPLKASIETLPLATNAIAPPEEGKEVREEPIHDMSGLEAADLPLAAPPPENRNTGTNAEEAEAEEVSDTPLSEGSGFVSASHLEAEREPENTVSAPQTGNLTLNVPNGDRFDAWSVWLNGEVQAQRGQGTATTFSSLPCRAYKVEIRTQSATAVYRAETSIEVLPNETTTAKLRLFPQ